MCVECTATPRHFLRGGKKMCLLCESCSTVHRLLLKICGISTFFFSFLQGQHSVPATKHSHRHRHFSASPSLRGTTAGGATKMYRSRLPLTCLRNSKHVRSLPFSKPSIYYGGATTSEHVCRLRMMSGQ